MDQLNHYRQIIQELLKETFLDENQTNYRNHHPVINPSDILEPLPLH